MPKIRHAKDMCLLSVLKHNFRTFIIRVMRVTHVTGHAGKKADIVTRAVKLDGFQRKVQMSFWL